MPRKIFTYIVALLFAVPLFAQFDFPVLGGRGSAMGGVSMTLDDVSSVMQGSAALGRMERAAVALGVRQDYMAKGMGYAMAGGIVPVGFGAVSASVIHFGNSDYNEQQVSLAYGMPIGKVFALGATFHYLHSGTSDAYYDPINRLTFSLALNASPSHELSFGFKAFNPIAVVSDNDGTYRIPALFCVGVSYRPMEELLSVAEVEKSLYQRPTVRVGLEYTMREMYFFRLGISTVPTIYTFGFGIKGRDFGFDIAAQVHSVLGMTPQLSVYYCF